MADYTDELLERASTVLYELERGADIPQRIRDNADFLRDNVVEEIERRATVTVTFTPAEKFDLGLILAHHTEGCCGYRIRELKEKVGIVS